MKQSRYTEYTERTPRLTRAEHERPPKEPLWPTLLGLILGAAIILALAFLWYFPSLRERGQGSAAVDATTPPSTAADVSADRQTQSTGTSRAPDKRTYRYYIDPETYMVKSMGEATSEVVFFTFNDAPAEYAVAMAELMRDNDCRAVFFANGNYITTDEQRARLKKLYDMGFEIGNQTLDHPHLRELSYTEKRDQIVGLSDQIEAITGERPRFFRPPYGEYDAETARICAEENLVLMTWTFGYDWREEYREVDALTEILLNNEYLYGGANILMHDNERVYRALPALIEGYRAKGYTIVDPAEIMDYAATAEWLKGRQE